jgi:hypothetical protein
MIKTNKLGQPIKDLATFGEVLQKDETFNNLSGKNWIGVCDTYGMLDMINNVPDVAWEEYRLIQITNKRNYYQLVKAWIDHNHADVRNMDYKPNKSFAYWVMCECRKLKAGLKDLT